MAEGSETLRSFSVTICPGTADGGAIEAMAAGPTATVAVCVAVPHAPAAVIVNAVVLFTRTAALPLSDGLATPGEMATLSALTADQYNVVVPPTANELGDATKLTI